MYKTDRECVEELVSALEAKGVLESSAMSYSDIEFFERTKSDEEIARCMDIVRNSSNAVDAMRMLSGAGMLNCKSVMVEGSMIFGFKRYLVADAAASGGCAVVDDFESGKRIGHSSASLSSALDGKNAGAAYVVLLADALTAMLDADYVRALRVLRDDESTQVLNKFVRMRMIELKPQYRHYCECHPKELLNNIDVMNEERAFAWLGGCIPADMTQGVILYMSEEYVAVKSGQLVRMLRVPECVFMNGMNTHTLQLLAELMLAYSGVSVSYLGSKGSATSKLLGAVDHVVTYEALKKIRDVSLGL